MNEVSRVAHPWYRIKPVLSGVPTKILPVKRMTSIEKTPSGPNPRSPMAKRSSDGWRNEFTSAALSFIARVSIRTTLSGASPGYTWS